MSNSKTFFNETLEKFAQLFKDSPETFEAQDLLINRNETDIVKLLDDNELLRSVIAPGGVGFEQGVHGESSEKAWLTQIVVSAFLEVAQFHGCYKEEYKFGTLASDLKLIITRFVIDSFVHQKD